MAENDQTNDNQAQQPPKPPALLPTIPQTAIAELQRAIAETARIAELEQKDETVEGGRYRLPSGLYVNAEGKPHKDQKSE